MSEVSKPLTESRVTVRGTNIIVGKDSTDTGGNLEILSKVGSSKFHQGAARFL